MIALPDLVEKSLDCLDDVLGLCSEHRSYLR